VGADPTLESRPSYSTLRAQWLAERQAQGLTKLPSANFLERCRDLRETLSQGPSDPLSAITADRFRFLELDLRIMRLEKIVNTVLWGVALDRHHLSPAEEQVFNSLSRIFDSHLRGPPPEKLVAGMMETTIPEPEMGLEPRTDYMIVRIRVPSIPKFLGVDGVEYGPLVAEDVVRLPRTNGRALESRGAVEELEIPL